MTVNDNHPCVGKDCKDCETCIFDVDLFKEKKDMDECFFCHDCNCLVKNYFDNDRIKFNACCSRSKIMWNGYTRPRIIKANVGPMLPIPTPDWCPKNRGVLSECVAADLSEEEAEQLALPAPPQVSTANKTYKNMTYSEKREKLMNMPRHLKWEEIEEGGIYVIPKILSQTRKVVRVVVKTDSILRCSEIDEYGKESTTLSSVYPKDIDMVFITKVLKF